MSEILTDGSLFNPAELTGAIFYGIVLLTITLIVIMLIRRAFNRFLRQPDKIPIDRTAMDFISQLLQLAVFLIALIYYFQLVPSLRNLGAAILATAGIASIVFGLAAQNTLGNIISGLSLLAFRPVRVGDRIKVHAAAGEELGIVHSISLGYTILRVEGNEQVIIPNIVLTSTVIVNYGNQGTGKVESPGEESRP
jgi:small-conductance mechanosensitive channel